MNYAACALVINKRRQVLTVWNKKLGGWCLPGGKQEDLESAEMTMVRELREETGLVSLSEHLLGEWEGDVVPGFMVSVFHVLGVTGRLNAGERECPVTWSASSKLFGDKVFGPFYTRHFPEGFHHLAMTRFRVT